LDRIYIERVSFKWNQAVLPGAIALIAAFVTGCGGLAATHSVSPASFLLPGLTHAPVSVLNPEPLPAEFDEPLAESEYRLASK